MGREIRRVPKGWEHPQNEYCKHFGGIEKAHNRYYKPGDFSYGKCFKPLYDQDIEASAKEWIEGLNLWLRGEHPDQKDGGASEFKYYWEWAGNPPNPEFYRPAWKPEEMTCYQIYETVSEGTPVSPVFETLDQMRDWLIEQGYSEAVANGFVKDGWVPSMIYSPQTGVVSGIDISGLDKNKK